MKCPKQSDTFIGSRRTTCRGIMLASNTEPELVIVIAVLFKTSQIPLRTFALGVGLSEEKNTLRNLNNYAVFRDNVDGYCIHTWTKI